MAAFTAATKTITTRRKSRRGTRTGIRKLKSDYFPASSQQVETGLEVPLEEEGEESREQYVDGHLKSLYYDLSKDSAYSSIQNLTLRAREYEITPDEVRSWLLSQDAYTRFRPARQHFSLNFYNIRALRDVFEIDLCDMQKYAEFNDCFKYFMTIIDCLSRFVWVYPLKTKTANEVATVLDQHFSAPERRCRLLQADKGNEFRAQRVQAILRKHKVTFRTLENRGKAAVVERVQQRLKAPLWKHMAHRATWRWLTPLAQIVHTYNRTMHGITKYRPIDVTEEHVFKIWSSNYLRHMRQQSAKKTPKHCRQNLKVGDHVRVSLVKTVMEKGYTPRWSTQLYIIRSITKFTPFPMYSLTDLQGERVKGNFYAEELLKVASPKSNTLFRVEKILQRRQRRGCQPEVLVRWSGYDKSFDSWEPESAVQAI